MSEAAQATVPLGRRVKRFMSDNPLVPLIVLLVALVVVLQFLRPGIVNAPVALCSEGLDRQDGKDARELEEPAGEVDAESFLFAPPSLSLVLVFLASWRSLSLPGSFKGA